MWTRLDKALLAAEDVQEASQVIVDHLVEQGLSRPSVYLARGNRLRIQAVHGYQQIFDGMPFGSGVIGSTYLAGEPLVVQDVDQHEGYLRANPSVRAEVCVPVRVDGRIAAILNVESPEPLPDERLDAIFGAAARFERALGRLGRLAPESPAQRLVRHATRLTTLTDERIIHGEAVAAACELAGMASGALLLPGPRGRFHAVEATGMLNDVLLSAHPAAIEAIARLVQSGCSLYTTGGVARASEELGALTSEGVQAVIAIPLTAGVDGRGVLLLADPRPLVPDTETVELLETLAVHAASCLRTAGALAELRARAATDPLTARGASRSPCSWPTSTASRRSTTRAATRPATASCARPPPRCPARCAAATSCFASAATSSRHSCASATRTRRSRPAAACAPASRRSARSRCRSAWRSRSATRRTPPCSLGPTVRSTA
jgi:putative methionine-R-sulfoxide reductase with GAF domain